MNTQTQEKSVDASTPPTPPPSCRSASDDYEGPRPFTAFDGHVELRAGNDLPRR